MNATWLRSVVDAELLVCGEEKKNCLWKITKTFLLRMTVSPRYGLASAWPFSAAVSEH